MDDKLPTSTMVPTPSPLKFFKLISEISGAVSALIAGIAWIGGHSAILVAIALYAGYLVIYGLFSSVFVAGFFVGQALNYFGWQNCHLFDWIRIVLTALLLISTATCLYRLQVKFNYMRHIFSELDYPTIEAPPKLVFIATYWLMTAPSMAFIGHRYLEAHKTEGFWPDLGLEHLPNVLSDSMNFGVSIMSNHLLVGLAGGILLVSMLVGGVHDLYRWWREQGSPH